MGFRDLREWIDKLESEGELKRIEAEVHWDIEIGAITRTVQDMMGPALLFENIKDYKNSWCRKFFTAGLAAPRRLSLMLGLPKDTDLKQQVEITRKRFKERIKPVMVDRGPVKENIIKGEGINIYELPVPRWYYMEGGRRINTSVGVVTKDPETGWVNVGMYSGFIVDERTIVVALVRQQHWGRHFSKYRAMGKPLPVAVVYGWDPAMIFVACSGIPPEISEYDIMGSIRQQPVELVKCETVDLEVPAWAEIVIEGYVSPDPATFQKHPIHQDYAGYMGPEYLMPVLKVGCITHRNDPIYRGTMEGAGPGHPTEDSVMEQLSTSALVWNILESAGLPGVSDVYMLPSSCVTNCVVQIRKTYLGQAKQVAMAIWGSWLPMWLCKNVIVVEEDIDIRNLEAVEWAIAYRVNPGHNDIVVVPGTPGTPQDPSCREPGRKEPLPKFNRMLIDATRNWEFQPQEEFGSTTYSPVACDIRPEDKELVKRRWKEYGF